jgi:hypothetical protein
MKHFAMLAAVTAFAWIATTPSPAEADPPKAARNIKPTKASPIKGGGARADQASGGGGTLNASCGDGEVMCGQGCCDTATEICGDGTCHAKENKASGGAQTEAARP